MRSPRCAARSTATVTPWVALSLYDLAARLDNLGRYEEAAALNEEALAIRRAEALAFRRQLAGDDDPRTAHARRVLDDATASAAPARRQSR